LAVDEELENYKIIPAEVLIELLTVVLEAVAVIIKISLLAQFSHLLQVQLVKEMQAAMATQDHHMVAEVVVVQDLQVNQPVQQHRHLQDVKEVPA
jgi:hypothetical protein